MLIVEMKAEIAEAQRMKDLGEGDDTDIKRLGSVVFLDGILMYTMLLFVKSSVISVRVKI